MRQAWLARLSRTSDILSPLLLFPFDFASSSIIQPDSNNTSQARKTHQIDQMDQMDQIGAGFTR
jgi:hypothetical protein